MENLSKLGKTVASALFTYNTSKVVNIQSGTVGIINRFVQLLIIGYVIGYVSHLLLLSKHSLYSFCINIYLAGGTYISWVQIDDVFESECLVIPLCGPPQF